jgi:hypothetical protein
MSLPPHFGYVTLLWRVGKYLFEWAGFIKKAPEVLDSSLKIANEALEFEKRLRERKHAPDVVIRDTATLVPPSTDGEMISTLSEIPKDPLENELPERELDLTPFMPDEGIKAHLKSESRARMREYMRNDEFYFRVVELERELQFRAVERKHAPDLLTFRQLREFFTPEEFVVYTRQKEIEKVLEEANNKRLQNAYKRLHQITKKLISKRMLVLLLAVALWQAVPVLYGEQGPTLVAACLILFWLLFRPSTHSADSRCGRALCLT